MLISTTKSVLKYVILTKVIMRRAIVRSNGSDVKLSINLKPWCEIPGPKSLPVIGQMHHYISGGELSNFGVGSIQKLYDKYGPIIRFDGLFGMGAMVAIADPEITAHVLRRENLSPLRPGMVSLEYYRKNYKKSKGHNVSITGLATDHGNTWKQFRSLVNPVIVTPITVKLYCNVLDEVAQDMIKRMKSNRDEKKMLRNNFEREMNLWALESIGTIALGCRLNSLDVTAPQESAQKELIQCTRELFIVASELDFKPSLWRYINTPTFKKAMKLYERHENLTKYFVKKGMEQLKLNASQKLEHEKGVLEKLLEINENYAYIMASDMLFAGVETTATALTSTLYLLATNQEKQEKLREELISNPERKYLKACIKEALRIMPVVSGNIRQATKEYNLIGYKIPKDTLILFSHREMSLMDKNYPRAKEYIPERWIAEKNDPLYYGNTHPFVYAPFGFGTRSCIGRRIAELEIETLLARIVENFKVEWIGPPPEIVSMSVNYFKGPFYFTFTDIK